jgi:uncharacterized protein YecE (DUF72 family)
MDRASAQPNTARAHARIGISGWTYAPWRGVFYPKGLVQSRELHFASRAFSSIEINGSFYSLMRPENYQLWYDETPPEFSFSVKGGRYITHLKRLNGVEGGLANFFASGILRLRKKLGPILWQLPPNFVFDEARLTAFLALLPQNTREASALARRHDARVQGRSETRALFDAPVRHVLEVRHESFSDPAYVRLLRRYGVASCVADSAGLYPLIEDVTAGFVYVRLHGAERLYTSGYGPQRLRTWATRIRAWLGGDVPKTAQLVAPELPVRHAPRDVFVYFDNDVKVRAPFDAANLWRLLNDERPKRIPKALATVSEEPRENWPSWRALSG